MRMCCFYCKTSQNAPNPLRYFCLCIINITSWPFLLLSFLAPNRPKRKMTCSRISISIKVPKKIIKRKCKNHLCFPKSWTTYIKNKITKSISIQNWSIEKKKKDQIIQCVGKFKKVEERMYNPTIGSNQVHRRRHKRQFHEGGQIQRCQSQQHQTHARYCYFHSGGNVTPSAIEIGRYHTRILWTC